LSPRQQTPQSQLLLPRDNRKYREHTLKAVLDKHTFSPRISSKNAAFAARKYERILQQAGDLYEGDSGGLRSARSADRVQPLDGKTSGAADVHSPTSKLSEAPGSIKKKDQATADPKRQISTAVAQLQETFQANKKIRIDKEQNVNLI